MWDIFSNNTIWEDFNNIVVMSTFSKILRWLLRSWMGSFELVMLSSKCWKTMAIRHQVSYDWLSIVWCWRSLHLLVFWILFENVMSLHRTKAAIIGLLEADRVNEWVVTEKLGNTMNKKISIKPQKKPRSRIGERYDAVCPGSPQGTF